MAEEFVDLYEVLKLPVDTDRNTVRKRINELYLDAQRNLDHRNFATRVQFQEMFEVILPQARYILLDDGRRDEYNRIVLAFRASKDGTLPRPSAQPAPKSSFSLEPQPDPSIPGERAIEPLPPDPVDPEQLAREREALWGKWKTGLEEALGAEKSRTDVPKARSAPTSAPTSSPSPGPSPAFSETPQSAPKMTPSPTAIQASVQASVQAAVQPATPATPKPAAKPKVNIAFDFEEKETPAEVMAAAGEMDNHGQAPITEEELESRRTDHRRQLMKEVLVNVGLIWACAGAAIILVPGIAGLIAFVGKNYPRNAPAHIKSVGSNVVWIAGFVVLGIVAYVVGQQLSKVMRRNKARELSFLSYEDLLKRVGKS